jgi:resuscitation-promoting factor RpfB
VISFSVRRTAQAAVVVSLVAGAFGAAQFDKSVALSVDGKSSAVHVFGNTVGDLLKHEGITLKSHDLVAPAVSTPLVDNQKIVVRYGRLLTVTVDGKTKEFWTTSTTVAGALSELGIRADSAKLSVSRSQPLGRLGLAMSVTTPKNVTVNVDGKKLKATTMSPTVAALLTELKVTMGAKDRIRPAIKTPILKPGMKVTVARVTQKRTGAAVGIAFGTTTRRDSKMFKGSTKTVVAGKAGRKMVSHLKTLVDGKVESDKVYRTIVTRKPVARVVHVGSKSRPAPVRVAAKASAPRASAPRASAPRSSGGGSTVNGAMWDRIAECESGGNWSINTGNGYYGGLQFDRQTWQGAGGGQYAPTANLASRTQQIAIANKVYADRGLQPWQCGHAA